MALPPWRKRAWRGAIVKLARGNTTKLLNATPCFSLFTILKGTATLMISIVYKNELCKPLILIYVSSKSVEKCGSCVRLNICKWTVMEAAIL